MKYKILIQLFICFFSATILLGCKDDVKCQEDINLLPMYGRVQKCKQQLEVDALFLKECDSSEPNRYKAAINVLETGWYYLHKGEYDKAMKRVNQAWLLDSTNIIIYASYIVILDLTNKVDDALKMLDFTLNKIEKRIEPENPDEFHQNKVSNQQLIEFIAENASFSYKKTHNLALARLLYARLDLLNMSGIDKDKLKNILITRMPELE